MKLHTTINFNTKIQKCQNKIFKLQIIYKIDGKKDNKEYQIDIASYYDKNQQICQYLICDQPFTQLKYRLWINIKKDQEKKYYTVNQNQSPITITISKTQKNIQKQSKQTKSYKLIQKSQNENIKSQRSLKKSILINKSQKTIKSEEQEQQKISQKQKNRKKLLTVNFSPSQQNQQIKLSGSSKKITNQSLNDQLRKNYDELQTKYNELSKYNENYKQQFLEIQKTCQQKQKNVKEIENKLNETIKKDEGQIKSLKQENKRLEKLMAQFSSINKNINIDQSLKPYKQRIKLLQRQVSQLQQQNNFLQKQSRDQKQQIGELRIKIKSLNQQNLLNLQLISNKDYQIEKLTKKLKNIQIELKQVQKNNNKDNDDDEEEDNVNHFKSQKFIGGGGSSNNISRLKTEINELKMKLSLTQKNLQNKEQLLKKFDIFSQQSKKQIQSQLQELRKQNSQLKSQQSKGQQKAGKNQFSNLQVKIQLDKLKKQIEYKTKTQRQLLIQKSQLQSRNKNLHEDVVKSKQSIANILNVIHEFGDEDLIEEVNTFLC